MPARVLAVAALLFNALVFGMLWWPFRALQAQGLHPLWATAFIYVIGLVGLLAPLPQAWPGLVRHPWPLPLVLAPGITHVGFKRSVTGGAVVRHVVLFYPMPPWGAGLAGGPTGPSRPGRLASRPIPLANPLAGGAYQPGPSTGPS